MEDRSGIEYRFRPSPPLGYKLVSPQPPLFDECFHFDITKHEEASEILQERGIEYARREFTNYGYSVREFILFDQPVASKQMFFRWDKEPPAWGNERLVLDLVGYILEQKLEPLEDVLDSLCVLFSAIFSKPHRYEKDSNNYSNNYTRRIALRRILATASDYEDHEHYDDMDENEYKYEDEWISDDEIEVITRNALGPNYAEITGDDSSYIPRNDPIWVGFWDSQTVDALIENFKNYNELTVQYTTRPYNPDSEKALRYRSISAVAGKVRQVAHETKSSRVTRVLASLYTSINWYKKAIESYKNMRRMEPQDRYNLGTIYLDMGEYELAKRQLQKAPELAEARYNLGVAHLYEGEWEQAAEQFRQTVVKYHSDRRNWSKQTDGLDHFIAQFSYNNLGISAYPQNKDAKEGAIEAMSMFRESSLWRSLTGRLDESYNMEQMTQIIYDITLERGKLKGVRAYVGVPGMVGSSESMQEVWKIVEKATKSDITVLIMGETGTGKELVARAIHDTGNRKEHPFVPVNCAAIPRELLESELFGHEEGAFTGATAQKIGLFEQAGDGTIFLDEIGEMALEAQAKLLRVIDNREFRRIGGKEILEVKARILVATNRDLEQEVEQGRFRKDLYYRINTLKIKLPPLRERREDIALLTNHFLFKAAENSETGLALSEPARTMLESYSWPGNVRQLQNAIEGAASEAEDEIIHSWDLPEEIRRELKDDKDVELMRIIEAFKAENGNSTKAAKRLGMPRSTFHHKVKKQYGIDLDGIRKEIKNGFTGTFYYGIIDFYETPKDMLDELTSLDDELDTSH